MNIEWKTARGAHRFWVCAIKWFQNLKPNVLDSSNQTISGFQVKRCWDSRSAASGIADEMIPEFQVKGCRDPSSNDVAIQCQSRSTPHVNGLRKSESNDLGMPDQKSSESQINCARDGKSNAFVQGLTPSVWAWTTLISAFAPLFKSEHL